jgi:hypothetical protein
MQALHTYTDGSVLYSISARRLKDIPIWKGNRILDSKHVAAIKASVADVRHLDSGFRIIKYSEEDAGGNIVLQQYIIDGQHRITVIKDYFENGLCEPDFMVTVTEKSVTSEADAIAYFNRINNAKPIHFKEDPVLVANKYVEALIKVYPPTRRVQLIKSIKTVRPYLSVDALREALIVLADRLPVLEEFGPRIMTTNARLLRELELSLASGKIKDVRAAERCLELSFALAFDPKLKWLVEICGA